MKIRLEARGGAPIYEQIQNQLRLEIVEGRLAPGESLPSIRSLAKDLQISVITTKRAYEELEREGLIYGVPQKGFYVTQQDPAILREQRLRMIDEKAEQFVRECQLAGLKAEEVCDMIKILYEPN